MKIYYCQIRVLTRTRKIPAGESPGSSLNHLTGTTALLIGPNK